MHETCVTGLAREDNDEGGGDYFQTVDTCPDGTVMDIKPFGAIISPGLHAEGYEDTASGQHRDCSYTIKVPDGETVGRHQPFEIKYLRWVEPSGDVNT